jgi:meso-butanediol dehydrogenase/(S,S)-butanediol dehydrogenase/diacetyl reductase
LAIEKLRSFGWERGMDFKDRIGVITGGATGIGNAVARGFAAGGGHSVIADFDQAAGQRAAAAIAATGTTASFLYCDLRDPAEPERLAGEIEAQFGRIDFLHNNAFGKWPGPDSLALTAHVTKEHWDHVMGIGIDAPFHLTRLLIPMMQRQRSGAIVNTASTASFRADPHVCAYSVAKAALAHFTRLVACEYAADGIRCNAVAPGVIETQLIAGAPLDENFISAIPVGRLGRAEEIANVILFLASDLASYVTGAVVVADGGRTL